MAKLVNTSVKAVNTHAANIVQRGTYAYLDLNRAGTLGSHIGCAYDVWYSEFMKENYLSDRIAEQVARRVRKTIESLGFTW